MQVKMIQCQAGSDFVRNPGDCCEVEDEEAKRMIEAGICEEATKEDKAKAKKAAKADDTETATSR